MQIRSIGPLTSCKLFLCLLLYSGHLALFSIRFKTHPLPLKTWFSMGLSVYQLTIPYFSQGLFLCVSPFPMLFRRFHRKSARCETETCSDFCPILMAEIAEKYEKTGEIKGDRLLHSDGFLLLLDSFRHDFQIFLEKISKTDVFWLNFSDFSKKSILNWQKSQLHFFLVFPAEFSEKSRNSKTLSRYHWIRVI